MAQFHAAHHKDGAPITTSPKCNCVLQPAKRVEELGPPRSGGIGDGWPVTSRNSEILIAKSIDPLNLDSHGIMVYLAPWQELVQWGVNMWKGYAA